MDFNRRRADPIDCAIGAAYDEPPAADALLGRAATMRRLGRPEEALLSFDRALALLPDSASIHLSRGAVLLELQRWQEALDSCDRAIALGFDRPEVYLNRVTPLLRLHRFEDALASCDRAMSGRHPISPAHILRGITLLDLRRPQEAAADFTRATELDPASADAQMWLGRALMDVGSRRDALACYDRALQRRPNFADAHNNRGIALFELGDWEAARMSYEHALSLDPGFAEALCNLGTLQQAQNRLEAALACFDKAIAIEPNFTKAQFNRATALLLAGNYEKGWTALEWRHRTRYGRRIDGERNLAQGSPDKASLRDRTVFVYGEWGLGDTIQFCRYVPLLAELGVRVILEVPDSLSNLLARLDGVCELIAPGHPTPRYDFHCPLLSLPQYFNTTLANVPAQVPYLSSDAARRGAWSERLGPRGKPRVGLVWSGGFRADQPEIWPVNERRNVPLDALAVLQNPSVDFYGLQKGQPAESELARLLAAGWKGPPLEDFARDLHDFAETAALIDQLDLIISVDTSTAHLAGALGKPVWILNRFDSCWRWLLHRTDSPWYPTARLYRQEVPGDWHGVLQRVRSDLAAWAPCS